MYSMYVITPHSHNNNTVKMYSHQTMRCFTNNMCHSSTYIYAVLILYIYIYIYTGTMSVCVAFREARQPE